MSDISPPASQSARRHGRPASPRLDSRRGLRARLRANAVVPVAIVSLVGVSAAAYQWFGKPGPGATLVLLGAVAAVCVTVLVRAVRRAGSDAECLLEQARNAEEAWRARNTDEDRAVVQRITVLQAQVSDGLKHIQRAMDEVGRGERPRVPAQELPAVDDGGPFGALARDLNGLCHAALTAIVQASSRQRVEIDVLVNLARRQQILVKRTLHELDDLEKKVENPEHLDYLWSIDHLVTRIRREVESLGVLGGAVPRQIGQDVDVQTVLRLATQEVEKYSRVEVIPPVEGVLRGYPTAEVIHLLAELIENATQFSSPHLAVQLRARHVRAGLAIDVADEGDLMDPGVLEKLNRLLASPEQVDIGGLLKDGRIGMFVAARLARRHGIGVQLQYNIVGGITATVVLPHNLLADPSPAPAQPAAASISPPPPAQLDRPAPAPATPPAARPVAITGQLAEEPAVGPWDNGSDLPGHPDALGADRPGLPYRQRAASPEQAEPVPAAQAAQAEPSVPHPRPSDGKPELPQRDRGRTYQAAALRNSRAPGSSGSTAQHDPNFAARFRSGFARVDDDDSPDATIPAPRTDNASR